MIAEIDATDTALLAFSFPASVLNNILFRIYIHSNNIPSEAFLFFYGKNYRFKLKTVVILIVKQIFLDNLSIFFYFFNPYA